jgi:hypothetical protein
LSTYIYATEIEKKTEKPRKRRRPVDLKSLQNKVKPTAWLRCLISPIDFGVKVRTVGPAGERVSRPVHCNTNVEIINAFRYGDWHRIERLSNWKLEEHWGELKTYYYTANGSIRNRFILVNIDIDCHATGSPEAAIEAAEYLKANFFPDLYHEPSTNGRGRHGYFILDKWDFGAEHLKAILKNLERRLNDHLLAQGFDIEMCEIKGLPPVVTWGNDNNISNYTAGILAKIPRQVHRFEEWKRTTVLNEFQLTRLITKLRSLTPEANSTSSGAATEENILRAKSKPSRTKISGSIGGTLISEEELAQIAEQGHYRKVAITLVESHVLKTSGRSVVTAEDLAAFLLLLKFFTDRMNADGTLPVRRFEGLWTGLYEAGDLERAFDCHRFKAIRDYLSDLGLIDWEDHTFVMPRIDETGQIRKGRACKWKAGASLMEMLDSEKWTTMTEIAEGLDGVDESDNSIHKGGEEKASFVGTGYEVTSPGDHEGERGEAPFVGTEESSPLLAPHPIYQMIRSLTFVSEDQTIRPVEQADCKAWHLFPDDVTLLISDIEDSIRLLAA